MLPENVPLTLLKVVVLVAAAYGALVAAMWAMQDRLLFPIATVAGAGTPLPPDTPRLEIVTPDGALLRGVRLVPPSSPVVDRVVVLGFGGNAWNAEDAAAYLREMFPHSEVVAFHYRGYPPSTGRAGVANLLADAPLIYDAVREGAQGARIVAVGFSVGSGVAVHLAEARPLDGLILVTPFDSLGALAADHFPWLPARRLLRQDMDNATVLKGLDIPTAIIAAEDDTIVPRARTVGLLPSIRRLAMNRTIPGVDHNAIYMRQEFTYAMREAMERIQRAWY